jgi:hypothetical protein
MAGRATQKSWISCPPAPRRTVRWTWTGLAPRVADGESQGGYQPNFYVVFWRSFAYQIGAEHNNLRNYVLRKTTIGVVSDYSSFVFSV